MTLAEFVNKLVWKTEGAGDLKKFNADLKELAGGASRAAARGIAAASVAATTFLGLAFKTAAAAEELDSQFDVVFGDGAERVREWAVATGDALGRSTQEIQRGAVAFQSLFDQAIGGDEAVQLSKDFAVLTQDLASFKDLSNEVAQQKLFSGLSGEAEPLRQVGVFLNAAAVEAKALELGLARNKKELTDQNKIVARAALIQAALSQATGDVERTQDSATNQLKNLNAEFEELRVVIGRDLLPVVTPLITKLSEFIKRVSDLNEETDGAVFKALAFAAALGPVLVIIGSILGPFITIIGLFVKYNAAVAAGAIVTGTFTAVALPLIATIAAVAAAIAAIVIIWRNWDRVVSAFTTRIAIIRSTFTALANYLTSTFQPVLDRISQSFETAQRAASFALRAGASVLPGASGIAANAAVSSIVNNNRGNTSAIRQSIKNEINVRGGPSDASTGRAVRDAITGAQRSSRLNGNLVGPVGF